MTAALQYKSPIKRWLEEHHMTHRELALRIGASENMTERYIAGTAVPSGARLAALVKLTGISRDKLEAGRYKPTA